MLKFERISTKAHEFSLGSKQSLTALVRRSRSSLDEADQAIITDLYRHGVHVTSVENLFPDVAGNIAGVLANAAAEMDINNPDAIPAHAVQQESSIDMRPRHLLTHFPEIFFLCLSHRMLNIVEAYLQLPVAYHGVALRHSLVDGNEVATRLWHMDSEDFSMVRVVIYLNDVTEGGGPFEYVPRSHGLTYKSFEGIEHKITAQEMRRVVPEGVFRQCYGKAGTVIICDTAKTFHHESLQVKQARTVAMYGFSSRLPRKIKNAMRLFPVETLSDQLRPLLSPSMLPYVFNWRR